MKSFIRDLKTFRTILCVVFFYLLMFSLEAQDIFTFDEVKLIYYLSIFSLSLVLLVSSSKKPLSNPRA